MTVSIGIHVHAGAERLRTTVAALAREELEPLVLAEPTAPASFNRLAADTSTRVVVLLESGAVPAPGALQRLVGALEAPPAGIAGPSTNLAWNEQCAFPGRRAADVVRTGEEAARRYGDETRSLGPLWGPADFCLAVRREVIEAIGGADEGFGAGPCWEMEYCARAVRAGFDARWVCGAYVWRAPYSGRRRRDEARLFEASKRRYQDNLCALRLRAARPGYEPHCRGDACEHFAPRELIALRRPLARAKPDPEPPRIAAAAPRKPVVSCVMPTRDRAEFALHAVDLFRRQDYPARELLVVDDGDDDLGRRLPQDERVRYLRAPRGESIGAKRNRAIEQARGELIAQWDDDDWYGPGRLSAQLAPLLAGRADLSGLTCPLFFELEAWRFWRITPSLHRRLFVGDVHGGTLAFTRAIWERARYPNLSLAEDAALLARARSRGGRLERVEGDGHFVYLRHAGNAWRFACGRHLGPSGWQRSAEPAFPPEDRAFYAARSRAAHDAGPPLVSCIMPTAGRRAWVPHALDYFARQDYPDRELLVLDDGDDPVENLVPDDPRIRYVPLGERLVLGEKRNRACELARGEIVVHWDDDDWHAPHRLSYQVEQLERHGAAVCGIRRVLYVDPAQRAAWRYDHLGSSQSWVAGNALAYRRSVWEEQRFPPVQVGEDSRFLAGRRAARPLVLDDHRFLVGVVHAGNTSPKRTTGPCWTARPLDEVRTLLGDDWERYEP